MTKRKKSRQYKVRDLSAARPKRGGGHNDDGSRKGGVTPAFRAGIVNGAPFLLTRNGRRVDLRTHAGRRFVTLIDAMVSDLGGAENVSTMEAQLVRRGAALAVDLEFQEAQALHDNDALDPAIYRTMVETQRHVLQALGLRRRARDITPRLADIIEGRAREVADG